MEQLHSAKKSRQTLRGFLDTERSTNETQDSDVDSYLAGIPISFLCSQGTFTAGKLETLVAL